MARGRMLLASLFIGLHATVSIAQTRANERSMSQAEEATMGATANALLAIDQHRETVIDRIVAQWGDALAQSKADLDRERLRTMLSGLRADHLLAASLAGTLDGLRDVLAHSLTATLVKPGFRQTKAVGDSGDDVAYTPVTPCRLVETRPGTFTAVYQGGGAFATNEIRNYAIQGGNGACLSQLPAGLNASAVQLQVFGIPINSGASGDVEVLPQGSTFGTTATLVYLGSELLTSASTTARINLANNQIGVQVRGGGANIAIDVVGYFKRPGNYGGVHTITGLNATDSGGSNNTASGNNSTVAGGGNNTVSEQYGAIAGGANNTVSGSNGYGFVGGGAFNTASGDSAVVAGGLENIASGDRSFIGGGVDNLASGALASIAGGDQNVAAGSYSAVPGGAQNEASGFASFAGGYRAKARGDGSFIWSDSLNFDFVNPASSPNVFAARATGGAAFYLGFNGSGGVTWSCIVQNGASGWSCTSDRNAKENLVAADTRAILDRVVALPIYAWNGKGVDSRDRHLGPMAQDFYSAFGLGLDNTRIASGDLSSVSLVAIQRLYELVQERDTRIAGLEKRLADVESLRSELAALKAALGERSKTHESVGVH